jgi:hypothetical protein
VIKKLSYEWNERNRTTAPSPCVSLPKGEGIVKPPALLPRPLGEGRDEGGKICRNLNRGMI